MIKFKIGEIYNCIALYGGFMFIKVIDRTQNTIKFVYLDDDEEEIHEKDIKIQTCTVFGKNCEILGSVDSEMIEAWKYHSIYAETNEFDYVYFSAFDNCKIYTTKEFNSLTKER